MVFLNLILVSLYIKKDISEGIYACNQNYWQVEQNGDVRQMEDEEAQTYATAMNSTNEQSKLKSANNFIRNILNMPLLLQTTLIISVILYLAILLLVCHISNKMNEASLVFAKIAFIVSDGNKVKTLNKLRLEIVNNHKPRNAKH